MNIILKKLGIISDEGKKKKVLIGCKCESVEGMKVKKLKKLIRDD